MNHRIFAAITRRTTAAVSRRGSLRVLSGAALAGALTAPTVARAGKAGKDENKTCKRLKTGCEAEVREFCQDETCLNALLPCCALLGQCKGRAATECFLSG